MGWVNGGGEVRQGGEGTGGGGQFMREEGEG